MPAPYYPIVYIRGYASLQSEINATVDDPFHGFNDGSTHIRVGATGAPDQFFFESPVVRLMTDYGYRDTFSGRTQGLTPEQAAALRGGGADLWRTIWIHRFYDASADTYGRKPRRLLVEEAAAELRDLIARIKRETGAPLVHLVSHSMGGLIARSLLQKVYPENGDDPRAHVARLFTYGTPHGGIQFRPGLGWLERVRDALGPFDSDTFGPDRLHALLTPGRKPDAKAPKQGFDPRVLTGPFPIDHVFCAIGTNAADYDVGKGASSFAVGPQSDGLVQIEAAYATDASGCAAHRAYLHRSHSGRYGLVNSEEAFQNLERFLFGTIQAIVSLTGVHELPSTRQKSYQLDLTVAVRGLPVVMHERSRARYCPILLNDPAIEEVQDTYPLFTQFLNATRAANQDGTCRFAIGCALHVFPVLKDGRIDYSQKIQGIADWSDQLLVDVRLPAAGAAAGPSVRYSWASESDAPHEDAALRRTADGGWQGTLPLPEGRVRALLGPRAQLRLEAYRWEA